MLQLSPALCTFVKPKKLWRTLRVRHSFLSFVFYYAYAILEAFWENMLLY